MSGTANSVIFPVVFVLLTGVCFEFDLLFLLVTCLCLPFDWLCLLLTLMVLLGDGVGVALDALPLAKVGAMVLALIASKARKTSRAPNLTCHDDKRDILHESFHNFIYIRF